MTTFNHLPCAERTPSVTPKAEVPARYRELAGIVVLKTESLSEFYDMVKSLEDYFGCADFLEWLAIEELAVARWRYLRYCGMERAFLRHATADNPEATVTLASCVGEKTADCFKRYKSLNARIFAGAVKLLKRSRKDFQGSEPRKRSLRPNTVMNPFGH